MDRPFDFARIEQLASSLPRKQEKLARELLDQPEVFAFGTLKALETTFGISGVTVIRFAKNLGYEGYSDLQEDVRRAYFERIGFQVPQDADEVIRQTRDAVQQATAQQRESLEMTYANLDPAALEKTAEAIVKARKIVVFGAGAAGLAGQLLVRLLRYVGLQGEWVPSAGVDAVLASHDLDERDVAIATSLWLDFTEASWFLRFCKARGATTIAIAGSHASPAIRMADIALMAQAQGTTQTFSLVAPIAMVELIVAQLATHFPERVVQIRQALHDHYVEEKLIEPKPRPNDSTN